jgi:hypothetical protein
METVSLKFLARKVLKRAGGEDKKVNGPQAFDPEGILEETIKEAKADGWTNDLLIEYIDALREAGALRAPWGLKIKGSPVIGDYWLLSDNEARVRIPVSATYFTFGEIKPIAWAYREFGASVVKVKRPKAIRN